MSPDPQPETAPVPMAALLRDGFRWFTERITARDVTEGREPLTTAQVMVMSYLRPDGIAVSELARRLGVSRQVAHVTVHELIDAGILALRPDPRSGRSKLVHTTPSGEQRRLAAWRILETLESELADRIGHDTVTALRRGLTTAWPPS